MNGTDMPMNRNARFSISAIVVIASLLLIIISQSNVSRIRIEPRYATVNDVDGDGHPLPCAVKTNPTPIILMSLGR